MATRLSILSHFWKLKLMEVRPLQDLNWVARNWGAYRRAYIYKHTTGGTENFGVLILQVSALLVPPQIFQTWWASGAYRSSHEFV